MMNVLGVLISVWSRGLSTYCILVTLQYCVLHFEHEHTTPGEGAPRALASFQGKVLPCA